MQLPSTTRLQLYGIALLCAFAASTGLTDNARSAFLGSAARAETVQQHGRVLHIRHTSTVTIGVVTLL